MIRPTEIPINYLVNESKIIQKPTDKPRHPVYFKSENYKERRHPFLHAFCASALQGFHWIPAHFEGGRKAEHWKSQQVFWIEFDEPIHNITGLHEFCSFDKFIREQAILVTDTVSSTLAKFTMRAYFIRERVSYSPQERDEYIRRLHKRYPRACKSGSTTSNGAFGRYGQDFLVLDNYWTESIAINTQKRSDAPVTHSLRMSGIKPHEIRFKENGWSIDRLPCAFSEHAGESPDAMTIAKLPNGYRGYCHKCKQSGILKI